jgi:para-aminobenzoate synthetase component 2
MSATKILVVDNYDSFVYTLVGYLQELGAETTVVRNDDVTLAEAIEMADARDGVLISPGPGTPAEAGVCIVRSKWCGSHR